MQESPGTQIEVWITYLSELAIKRMHQTVRVALKTLACALRKFWRLRACALMVMVMVMVKIM